MGGLGHKGPTSMLPRARSSMGGCACGLGSGKLLCKQRCNAAASWTHSRLRSQATELRSAPG
jgi:hypothetical protein